jgi:hypothetical protein
MSKGADLIIFLRDANDEKWREALKNEESRCAAESRHLAVFGVCDRNVECWLCCHCEWIAKQTGIQPNEFRVGDPKGIFELALEISGPDRKEEAIATLVKDAPTEVLRHWLTNRSFEDFYGKLWQQSKRLRERFPDCSLENLRQSSL